MIDYSYVIKNYNVHWYNYTSGLQWTLVCNTTEVVIAYSICVYSDGGTVHVHQNSVLQTLTRQAWNNTVCLLSSWWVRLISSCVANEYLYLGSSGLAQSCRNLTAERGGEGEAATGSHASCTVYKITMWNRLHCLMWGEGNNSCIQDMRQYQLLLPLHLYLLLIRVHKNGRLE